MEAALSSHDMTSSLDLWLQWWNSGDAVLYCCSTQQLMKAVEKFINTHLQSASSWGKQDHCHLSWPLPTCLSLSSWMGRTIDALLIPRRNSQSDILTCPSVVRQQIIKTLMLNSSRLSLDDCWPMWSQDYQVSPPVSQPIHVNNSSLLLPGGHLFFPPISCRDLFNLKGLYSCYHNVSLKLELMCRDHNWYAGNVVYMHLRHSELSSFFLLLCNLDRNRRTSSS